MLVPHLCVSYLCFDSLDGFQQRTQLLAKLQHNNWHGLEKKENG